MNYIKFWVFLLQFRLIKNADVKNVTVGIGKMSPEGFGMSDYAPRVMYDITNVVLVLIVW